MKTTQKTKTHRIRLLARAFSLRDGFENHAASVKMGEQEELCRVRWFMTDAFGAETHTLMRIARCSELGQEGQPRGD